MQTATTEAPAATGTITRLTPLDVDRRRRAGERLSLIDVRTGMEFAQVRAESATHAPLDSFDPNVLPCPAGSTPVLLCKSGGRATKAAHLLAAQGIDCVVVEGGTDAWVAAGLPIVRERTGMSLERQVRIAAGSLVLVGVLLAWLAHPYFIGLSAFVGAGLIVAGVTNTCGMGLILARMPWNRV
jgi:rhodanese-related sulfurtransferase